MAAAIAGQGVMLGWQHMPRELIAKRLLVCAHPGQVTAGRGDFLNCRQKSLKRPGVAGFVTHGLGETRAAG